MIIFTSSSKSADISSNSDLQGLQLRNFVSICSHSVSSVPKACSSVLCLLGWTTYLWALSLFFLPYLFSKLMLVALCNPVLIFWLSPTIYLYFSLRLTKLWFWVKLFLSVFGYFTFFLMLAKLDFCSPLKSTLPNTLLFLLSLILLFSDDFSVSLLAWDTLFGLWFSLWFTWVLWRGPFRCTCVLVLSMYTLWLFSVFTTFFLGY